MGIYDRDYYRNPPRRGGFGSFSFWSVTTWIVLINVVVFIVDTALWHNRAREVFGPDINRVPSAYRSILYAQVEKPAEMLGAFSVTAAISKLQVWRFLTFQFLHANFTHLAVNMLGLLFFGPIVERWFGWRRFLAFYLLCGIGGAAFYMLLLSTGFLALHPGSLLIGASAGIFGVLVGAALIAPNTEVILLFPPIPMQIKYLAMIMGGIAVWTTFSNGYNAGGEASHLGGAAMGFLLVWFPKALNVFEFRWARRRPRMRFRDWSQDLDH